MDFPKSVPSVGLVNGKFVDEDVNSGTQGSLIPAAWGNAVTQEVLNVIAGGGLEPDESKVNQLLAAIKSIIAGQVTTLKNILRMTTSGNFTVPAGVFWIWASGCAGGGGGGSTLATNASSFLTGGSGGGAGQPVIRYPIAVTPGQVIPVTIGAGGTGATPAANNATAGGATRLGASGALLNLLGGSAGQVGTGGTAVGAYGGPPGGGGYPAGSPAMDTTVYSGGVAVGGMGGVGASGPFGSAGGAGRGASGGSTLSGAGYGYGAGGSGAGGAYSSTVSAAGQPGAAGLPGILIIEW